MTSHDEAKQLRILLVDDDRVDTRAIARVMSTMDPPCALDTATSLAEARAKLGKASYDVAILDYELSDGTGLDIVPALGSIPTILLTGAGRVSVAAKALRLGVSDYLVKDFSQIYLKKLPGMIERAIAQRSKELDHLRILKELLADIVDNAAEALAGMPAESAAKTHVERIVESARQASEVCSRMLARDVVHSEPPQRSTRDPEQQG